MRLLLMRHGEASWRSVSDAERPLTARGEDQTALVVRERHLELSQVEAVWVSPYLRARQTAELVLETFPHIPLHQSVLLTPDADLAALLVQLGQVQVSSLLLVTHNPLVSRVANLLLGEAGRYQLGTSALLALEMDVLAAGCAELCWINPGH